MDVYIEITYIINEIILMIVFEMMSILLNVNWKFNRILLYSCLCNISVFVIYIDYMPYITLIYWLIIFIMLLRKQFFLYFPVFLIIYFSILLFINTLIQYSFIYNAILITPVSIYNLVVMMIVVVFVIVEVMYIMFVKKKMKVEDDLYPVIFVYQKQKYKCNGFLDTGNHAYYKGFPLIFIRQSLLKDYIAIDRLTVTGLKSQFVDIIEIETCYINHQQLHHIYVGVLKHLEYDCLLNKELMGGII